MQINKVQSNTSFTSIRFTKNAKNLVLSEASVKEIKQIGQMVKEHENIKPDVIFGAYKDWFGQKRLVANVDGEFLEETSILTIDNFKFLKDTVEYAKSIYDELGTSASDFMKNINHK